MKAEQGFTTLDNIIRDLLINEQRTTLHKYIWYLSYIIKSYLIFRLDESREVKTTRLTMDSKKAVKYPLDLVQWNKIGLMWNDRVKIFVPDETIAFYFEKEGAVYQPNEPWISRDEMEMQFFNYYNNVGEYSNIRLKGKGYNAIGYYRFNDACREIQFSADVDQCAVYVEYIATCTSPCNKTYVPMVAIDMFQEAIKFFDFKYRYGEHDRRTQLQGSAWERETMRYKGRVSDLSYDGLRNTLFRTIHKFFKI